MSDLRKAAEMALEVMEYNRANGTPNMGAAIEALRQALAQPDEVLAEREACAKLCDEMWHEWLDSPTENEINKPDAEDCADAIRARSEK